MIKRVISSKADMSVVVINHLGKSLSKFSSEIEGLSECSCES